MGPAGQRLRRCQMSEGYAANLMTTIGLKGTSTAGHAHDHEGFVAL
jgi:hypothetical protein